MATESVGVKKTSGLSAIPTEERKSFLSITMVWTGFVFVVSSMMAGGGLASGLTLKEIVFVSMLGNVFLSSIAILMSIIASNTGLSFALLSRYSFGIKGSRIASFFVPVVNIGWYTIQAAVYGHLIALIFNLSTTGEYIAMMASAIIMGVFALIGMEALTVLGFVAIPSIIFLSLATTIKATGIAGGISAIAQITPENSISIGAGLTIVIGTWVFSASTCIADFMRYAKNIKEAALSATTGLVLGNSLLIVCGAITALALSDSDLPNVLLSMGLVIPSLILMTTNIFTTNGGNVYSTGLNLSNALNMDSRKSIGIVLIISALLTLTKPYEIDPLFTFLNTLGSVVPPLPGIIFADYFLIKKRRYNEISPDSLYDWNILAWISWILAVVFVFSVDIGFKPVNGILFGFGLYYILMKIVGPKIHKKLI